MNGRNLKVTIRGEQLQNESPSLSLPNTGQPRAPRFPTRDTHPTIQNLGHISHSSQNFPNHTAREVLSLRILMLSKDMVLAHTCTHMRIHHTHKNTALPLRS